MTTWQKVRRMLALAVALVALGCEVEVPCTTVGDLVYVGNGVSVTFGPWGEAHCWREVRP